MKDFFAVMYELFIGWYGQELGDHLYGLNPQTGSNYDSSSLYVIIGFIGLFSSLLITLIYYKFWDSPTYNTWKHWSLALLGNLIINFSLGFYLPYKDYQIGNIAPSIRDAIDTSDITAFAFGNIFWALIWFLLFSIIIRHFSKNNRLTPFGFKYGL